MTDPFPELALLSQLPPGTVLDGELVALHQGRPQLALIQGRHQLRSRQRIRTCAQSMPCTLVVFDQLYDHYRSLLGQPLWVRREILQAAVTDLGSARLVFSERLVGQGRTLYQQVLERQLEGVMAKRLTSRYRPGRRGDAWLKIKPT